MGVVIWYGRFPSSTEVVGVGINFGCFNLFPALLDGEDDDDDIINLDGVLLLPLSDFLRNDDDGDNLLFVLDG